MHASGFEAHSETYRRHWSDDPVAQGMRERVHMEFVQRVLPGSHVLDLGCGAGCDSAWLVSQGYRVTAVDATTSMVRQTSQRVPQATVFKGRAEELSHLPITPNVNVVLLNFGVVNAIDPVLFMREVEAFLLPGAQIFVVAMPRIHVAWLIRCCLHLDIRGAQNRCRAEVKVDVCGQQVSTRYFNVGELGLDWPGWRCSHFRGLGMLVPPQSRFSRLMSRKFFGWADDMVAQLPILWQYGDHALSIWHKPLP